MKRIMNFLKSNILSLSLECMRKDTNKSCLHRWKWSHIELHENSYPYLQTHSQSTASTQCDWCAWREWGNFLGRYRVSNIFIFMKMPSWIHLLILFKAQHAEAESDREKESMWHFREDTFFLCINVMNKKNIKFCCEKRQERYQCGHIFLNWHPRVENNER